MIFFRQINDQDKPVDRTTQWFLDKKNKITWGNSRWRTYRINIPSYIISQAIILPSLAFGLLVFT